MFADACQKVMEFTKPVIVSTRLQDGTVKTECGTFIILNREGWAMTAGHLFDSLVKFQTDQNKLKEIAALNESRRGLPGAPPVEVKPDPTYITNHSFWWGWDRVRMNSIFVNRQIDIAVGKLEQFNPDWVAEYPVLKDPEHLRPGTSICRMGYSFLDIKSNFDEKTKGFMIPKIDARNLVFPNEGMHTRTLNLGMTKDGKFERLYVETSTPGLKGQSGGPIFDRDGHLYAMQVNTAHLPLGFHPTAQYDGNAVVENQVLNVGNGVHMKTIRAVLDDRGVRYDAEGDESGFRIID